jgi:hypothetical protein
MSSKETIDKAYGNIPKEVTPSFTFFDFIEFRGIRYYLIRFIRRQKGR